MRKNFIQLYGCGECGSEHTAKESRKYSPNGKKRICNFCSSRKELEYLGTFDKATLYQN